MRTYYQRRIIDDWKETITIDFVLGTVVFDTLKELNKSYPILRDREKIDSLGNVSTVTEIARLDTSLSCYIEYEQVSNYVKGVFLECVEKSNLRQVHFTDGLIEVYTRLPQPKWGNTVCLEFKQYVERDGKKFMFVLKNLVDFVSGLDLENNDISGGLECHQIEIID